MMDRQHKKNDGIFLGTIFLILIVLCAWFYFFRGEEGAVVKVTVNGQLYGAYSLKEDQEIIISVDNSFTNVLQIKDGKADMFAADCPDLLCVHQKAISKEKETIVCLPHKVVVEIIGGEESELDSVT